MPPRGVKSAKRQRQYEKIKASAKKRGRSSGTAKRIAAATVNKQRREAGETEGGRTRGAAKKRRAAKRSTKRSAKRSAKRSTRRSSKRSTKRSSRSR